MNYHHLTHLIWSTAQVHFTFSRTPNTARDRLYNDVLKCLKDIGVGFTVTQLNTTGTKIIDTLNGVLWYLDPFHQRLEDRACKIPKPLSHLHGYKDWRKQHKKEPRVRFKFSPGLDIIEGEAQHFLQFICGPSKDSEQPVHQYILIGDLASHMKEHWALSYPQSMQRRLSRLQGCAC